MSKAWLVGLALLLGSCVPANAQDALIKIIVPVAAGNATDILAREIASGLEKQTTLHFVVINKPGASGSIGTQDMLNANDNTLLFTSSILTASLKDAKYTLDDLKPLGIVAVSPLLLVTNKAKYTTLHELITASKVNQIFYGTPGTHTPVDYASIRFGKIVGMFDNEGIVYKGTAEMMIDFYAERLDYIIEPVSVVRDGLNNGSLVALAYFSKTHLEGLEVPTLSDYTFWNGIFASKGIDPATEGEIRIGLARVKTSDQYQSFIRKFGLQNGNGIDLAATMKNDIELYQ